MPAEAGVAPARGAGGSPAPKARLDYIDGLRAVAVVAVVLFHSAIWARLPRDGATFRTLAVGRAGVDVFLVLSGFCLFYPLVKGGGPVARLRPRDYLRRRLRRIAPPYYAALAVVAAVSGLVYAASAGPVRWTQHLFPSARIRLAADTLAHLTMLHGLANRTAHGFDGAFWSISLEWQFYLLFIPLAAVARRSVALAIAIPLVATIAYRSAFAAFWPGDLRSYVGNEISVGRWSEFAAGMAAAYLAARGRPIGKVGRTARLGLMLVALGGTLAYEVRSEGSGAFLPLAWSAVGFALIAEAGALGPFRRVLESKPCLFLGRTSYSIYLVHGSAMMLLALAAELVGLADGPRQVAVMVLAPPLAIGAGVVFFLGVERHFLPASLARVEAGENGGEAGLPPPDAGTLLGRLMRRGRAPSKA